MKKLLPLFLIVLLFTGCVKHIDNPSWIEITKWDLLANSNLGAEEGELTHNFKDAKVFANGQLVGIFELPVKLPLLQEGTTKFQLIPTVLNNGISATKASYPFVEIYEVTVDLVKNETVVINPVTKYKDEVEFWIEDFEETGKFESDPSSPTNLVQANDPAILKYGDYYGHIALTTDKTFYAGYTADTQNEHLVLPKNGADVYLEIDYRSTNSLITGLIEHSATTIQNHTNIQLNAQNPNGTVVWKKIYIDLKEIVSNTPESEYYKISLSAFLNDGGIARDIVIDNVKVLHF
jgi:hypothetical protein